MKFVPHDEIPLTWVLLDGDEPVIALTEELFEDMISYDGAALQRAVQLTNTIADQYDNEKRHEIADAVCDLIAIIAELD